MKLNKKIFLTIALLTAGLCASKYEAKAQLVPNQDLPPLEVYFTPSTTVPTAPMLDGFIQRWTLLEPISKPDAYNPNFVDSYIRKVFNVEYFKGQFDNALPDTKKAVKSVNGDIKQTLKWHALDSKFFYIKLYRLATNTHPENAFNSIFWAVTEIDCPQGLQNVRLAAGSNSSSLWWIDGEEVLMMSNDRRMVRDDCASKRLNLAPGKHIIRVAVMNGPGMSEFCARFIDEDGNAVINYTINNAPAKKK